MKKLRGPLSFTKAKSVSSLSFMAAFFQSGSSILMRYSRCVAVTLVIPLILNLASASAIQPAAEKSRASVV